MKIAITGAFSYSGKYIAQRLLDRGEQVLTLTSHPDRPDPQSRVERGLSAVQQGPPQHRPRHQSGTGAIRDGYSAEGNGVYRDLAKDRWAH